jgi:carboxypeptidase family protein
VKRFLCAVLVTIAPIRAWLQSPVAPAARADVTITGRVVADDTGDPIPNARVALHPAGDAAPVVVLADSGGRFSIAAAIQGRSTIAASKTGYARRQLTPTMGTIEIRLKRSATIAGRIIDEFGDPVINARVMAETVAGPRQNSPIVAATSMTDDLGEYRLAGLDAGPLTVAVMTIQTVAADPRGRAGPSKTYYPGVASARAAEPLQLEPGAERLGIDFVLPAQRAGPPALVAGPGGQPMEPPRLTNGTGTVRGQVVTTDGRAVPHATVLLIAATLLQWQGAIADADGAFEIRDVPPGRFRIRASKSGYSLIPPLKPGDTPLTSETSFELAEGQTRDRVTLGLVRWRALTGRIFDELGDPLQGASVSVMQVRYEAGRRRLVPVGTATRATDDLGRYRIFDLPPGRYIVSASIGGVFADDLPGYARSYYPGTANTGEAQFVSVGTSQDTAGVEFALSRTRTARITGRAINSTGEPITGGLTLFSTRASAVSSSYGARIQPDGAFEFPNVPPGQYVIQAYRGRSGESTEGEFGAMSVSIDGRDVTGLTLQTTTGSRIVGRVRLDAYSGSKPPEPSAIIVSPIPVDFDAAPSLSAVAELKSDWTFELNGINGPRRLALLRTPPEWMLSAIRVNGVDVTDRPLQFGGAARALTDVEVVLTDRVSELAATVVDDRRAPVPGANVLVFSSSRDDWYPGSRFLRQAKAGADGTASVKGLPAGNYGVVALAAAPSDDDESWQDPVFLNALAATASLLTISEGQKQAATLRVIARPTQ